MNSRLLLLLSILALVSFGPRPTVGEELTTALMAIAQETEPAAFEADPEASLSTEVTPAAIEKVKAEATAAEQLPEETKAQIVELCDKALASLADAQNLAATTAALQAELDGATSELEALQAETPAANPEAVSIKGLNADEIRALLSTADQEVSTAREKMHKVASEIERRALRRKELPDALAKCREQLGKLNEVLAQPVTGEPPLVAEARRLCTLARHTALVKELLLIKQQARTFEATSRLWLARRDAADKKVAAAEDKHKKINELAAAAQREEAAQQALAARKAAVNAHPAVKEAAAKSAELAERNQALVRRTQEVQTRLTEAQELGRTMTDRYEDVTRRANAAKNTPAIGEMLRSQQDKLPALGPYRIRLRNREVELPRLGFEALEWESMRREAVHVEKAVEQAIAEIEANSEETLHEYIQAELHSVFKERAVILTELISNANDCMSRLEELDVAEKEVVKTTEQLASFIAEQVLWVRSASGFSNKELEYAKNFSTNIPGRIEQAKSLLAVLRADLRQRPGTWGLAGVLVFVLLIGIPRARKVLRTRGEIAVKQTATQFRPTVEATLATLFLALPVPVVVGFVGWRLYQDPAGLAYATGWAFLLYAAVYAMLNLVRLASRTDGLGTNHFGWDQKGLADIRRASRSLQLFVLPLLAVAVGVEFAHDQDSADAIGRIALISSLLILSGISFRLFRPKGALALALASHAKSSLSARAVRVLAPLATLAALGLIVASATGYHYTAVQLTKRVFVSCVFVFACLSLRSLLMRWLLVSYRKAAMQRAREKRQAMLEAQENGTADTPVVETEPHVSLSDINQQARKLVAVGAALAFVTSMFFVWSDVLPALGIFSRVELWTSGLASLDPEAGVTYITLTDVFFACAIFGLTIFAGRNLPGLLEIAILRRLPLDAGARYAASSVTCYAIMVVGVALGMRQLGVGWQSVQWLVAAMTVGLGFGLQEIFANFVSGIILLFERPARVGDTVTIGTITGTVTKIRIRATTILDWDNKELIVPNKEFVTGNLVNWTLSNANIRLVVKVGVAYGTDTRLATELLYRIAEEHPDVMEEPEPVVVFNAFGDSSLNFELRVFVSDLSMYRRLQHDLHMAIDDVFKQNDIEIAFPQCDLHVRSLPAALRKSFSAPQTAKLPDPREAAA